MKRLLLLLVAVIACNAACFTESFEGKYARCQSLNSYYDIYWNIEENDLTILIHLRGMTNAWVGLGTSVNGGMRGADIAIAQQIKGEYVLEDRFVPGTEGTPTMDAHQDLTLISATSDNTSTTVIFKRKLIPCDVNEDVPIQKDGTPIIFAYGTSFGYHGANRGSATVFFHYVPPVKQLPNDTQAITLTFPAYEIPAKDTTYVCSPAELPYEEKAHIVRWRPLITRGSEAFVHHMVIFTCPKPPNETEPYECGMAPPNCNGFLVAWSLGQTGDDWLDNFGLPIGGEGGPRYAILQMHYNNPNEVAGVVDSSGIQLFFTTSLRQYDMGLLTMTTSMSQIFIPPHRDDITQMVECPSECTAKLPNPITIVGYFPHMHEIGQKIWMQHIRDEVELPEIHRDDHYDFQRQQSYNRNVTILPGDRLRAHCVWNSMNKNTNTTGGESSSQEMCVVIMQYFPAQKSMPSCSYRGTGSVCGGQIPAPYNYTALPAPMFTCKDDAKSTADHIAPIAISIIVLVLAIIL